MGSLSTSCKLLVFAFVLFALVSLVAAFSWFSLGQYLRELESGGVVDYTKSEAFDSRHAVMGGIQAALFVLCAAAFLTWFFRAHKNLSQRGIAELDYSSRWAVGGFFVPFLNMVRPFQVMKEVWRGSAALAKDIPRKSQWAIPIPPLLGWWWALFLISTSLGRVAGRLVLRAEELGEIYFAIWLTVASDLVYVSAAIVTVVLVARVTGLQEEAGIRLGRQRHAVA